MKKTTVIIDEKLLSSAMEVIGAKSKREAIIVGLETLVREKNRAKLREELGTFDLDIDLKQLDELRNAD